MPLLGKFTYQHNDGSSVTCTSSSDVRVCPDWTTMAFNYSLCATTQAFSRRFKHIKQKQKMKKNVQSLDYTLFDYMLTHITGMSSFVLTEDGVVHCLHTVTVGSTYYLTVLNPGPVDDSLYHRFTCYVCSCKLQRTAFIVIIVHFKRVS